MRLPGQFFKDPCSVPPQATSDLESDLRDFLRRIQPKPTAWHSRHDEPPVFVSPSLSEASHVFVRVDGYKPPLQPPYKGPYRVLQRGMKAYLLDLDGKTDLVAVDRLKPAFTSCPEDTSIVDPSSSIVAPVPVPVAVQTPSDSPRTSRYGRTLRLPQWYQ